MAEGSLTDVETLAAALSATVQRQTETVQRQSEVIADLATKLLVMLGAATGGPAVQRASLQVAQSEPMSRFSGNRVTLEKMLADAKGSQPAPAPLSPGRAESPSL